MSCRADSHVRAGRFVGELVDSPHCSSSASVSTSMTSQCCSKCRSSIVEPIAVRTQAVRSIAAEHETGVDLVDSTGTHVADVDGDLIGVGLSSQTDHFGARPEGGQWKLGESVPEDSFEIGLVEQIGLWVAVGLIVRIALESSENLMIGVNDLKA